VDINQQLHNGSRAREVLDNEQFHEAFEAIEKELIDAWKQSPQRDQEGRERIHQYLSLLAKVKSHLVSTMETGKLAELEVRHKQTLLERAREWVA